MRDYPLISVIVPVYNDELHIGQCIESILNQSYKNIELIVINDGSTDNSETICQSYARRDQRVRLISQNNSGSAAARNTGLSLANGTLIGFVDSDDKVNSVMYETLFANMRETGADIVFCDYNSNGVAEHPEWTSETFKTKEQIFSEYVKGGIINRICSSLYKRELIQDILFPENRDMMEDAFWKAHVLEKAEIVTRLDLPLYYYTDNSEGQTRAKISHKKCCSRFSNILEKEDVCLKNVKTQSDRRLVARELNGFICQMMESNYDLSLFGVDDKLQEIVKTHYQTLLDAILDKDEQIMLDAILTGDILFAKKEYRKAVWFYGKSIKKRLHLLKQMAVSKKIKRGRSAENPIK